jgi:hypothetical protein
VSDAGKAPTRPLTRIRAEDHDAVGAGISNGVATPVLRQRFNADTDVDAADDSDDDDETRPLDRDFGTAVCTLSSTRAALEWLKSAGDATALQLEHYIEVVAFREIDARLPELERSFRDANADGSGRYARSLATCVYARCALCRT